MSPVISGTSPATSRGRAWLERKPILRFCYKRYKEWRLRHQLPVNFCLHMIGIPLALLGVVMLFTRPWYWGTSFLGVGYLLQWIGHRAEGNDVGEWAGIKHLLGLPYVGISPRWLQTPVVHSSPESSSNESSITRQ